MANDRVYLLCEKCRTLHFLSTYYPGMGWGIPTSEDAGLFVERHNRCFPPEPGGDLGPGRLFSIVGEQWIVDNMSPDERSQLPQWRPWRRSTPESRAEAGGVSFVLGKQSRGGGWMGR